MGKLDYMIGTYTALLEDDESGVCDLVMNTK